MKDAAAQSTRQKIVKILAEQAVLDSAEIHDASTLEDLGIDSLGLVEIVFSIEEAFDVTVPFNANDTESSEFDISSVDSLVKAVEKLVADRA